MDPDEARLIALEERVAYQARLLAQLDDVVLGFARRVEELEAIVRELRQAPQRGVDDLDPHDSPPPHY